MTLAMNLKGKECIIMAIDSRLTNYDENRNFWFHEDSINKIFILPNNLAVSISGNIAAFKIKNNTITSKYSYKDVRDMIYGFEQNSYSKFMTISDTIEYFKSKFENYYREYTTQIHIGGSQNGKLVFKKLYFMDGKYCEDKDDKEENYYIGYDYSGANNEQTWSSMIKNSKEKSDISEEDFTNNFISRKNNRELITFADNVIKDVISVNLKKNMEEQYVGGNIDIVQITREKTIWIRKNGKENGMFLKKIFNL